MRDTELPIEIDLSKAIVQRLQGAEYNPGDLEVDVLRLDLLHPVISGNKWFKLKYYLKKALGEEKGILTFGGAYSNHIIATAAAAAAVGIPSVGMIRGEPGKYESKTLLDAKAYGMQLHFIPRDQFRERNSAGFHEYLAKEYPHFLLVPEGGAGMPGVKGASEILGLTDKSKYSHIIAASGTSTMLLGLIMASSLPQRVLGICVLKGMNDILKSQTIFKIPEEKIPFCQVQYDYHFGGYGKKNGELIQFMNNFFDQEGIPTDFVYTAKLMFALTDMIKRKQFQPGSRLLVIHSGGLQANRSLKPDLLKF